MIRYYLTLFLLTGALCMQAQDRNVRIGNAIGLGRHSLSDDLVNSNLYGNTTLSLLNLEAFKIKGDDFWQVSLDTRYSALRRRGDDSDVLIDMFNVAWNLTYHKKILEFGSNKSLYIGGGYHLHGAVFDQEIRGFNQSISVLFAPMELSLSPLLTLARGNKMWVFEAAVGLFSRWMHAYPYSYQIADYDFKTDFIGGFANVAFSISYIASMSERWDFKPEFRMHYHKYTTEDLYQVRYLKQSWTLGFFYRL